MTMGTSFLPQLEAEIRLDSRSGMEAAFFRLSISSIIATNFMMKVGPRQEKAGVGVEIFCMAGDWQIYVL